MFLLTINISSVLKVSKKEIIIFYLLKKIIFFIESIQIYLPLLFFDKCYDGTLVEDDFNFNKNGKDENSIKGSVRRKIKSLEKISTLFQDDILIEEDFRRNKIVCALATTDTQITLGFSDGTVSRPKTLLKGNELKTNPLTVDLVLSKKRNEKKFNKIVIGNTELVKEFSDKISNLITEEIK